MSPKLKRGKKRNIKSVEVAEKGDDDETPYQKLLNTFTHKSKTVKNLLKKCREKTLLETDKEASENVIRETEKDDINDEVDQDLVENTMGENDEMSETEELSADEDKDDEVDSESDSEYESLVKVNEHGKSGIKDPFSLHFETDLTEDTVKDLEKGLSEVVKDKISAIGCVDQSLPKADVPRSKYQSFYEDACLLNAQVKEKIINNWDKVNQRKKEQGPFSELQNSLFNIINNYQDVFYTQRDFRNGDEVRRLYCLHAINHVLKTRSRILKNNAKIIQAQKDGKEAPDFRDHGLTRPKVLILVPFRDCALKIVKLLTELALPSGEKVQVMQKKRFYDEFKGDPVDDSGSRYIPDDFKEMFHGNTDDCFRIGITVMRKAIKLYADFYAADILIASPLGLRTIIGAKGDKHRDYDFLSSIEVLIFDQTDVFLMQNWEYVLDIIQHLHLKPKDSHDTDFSRVRMWTLNYWSKFYRQTLMFSSFSTPEMNSVYNKYFTSKDYAGKVRIRASSVSGAVKQVVKLIPQIFQRVDTTSLVDAAEHRFNYFMKEVLPNFKDNLTSQTAIFIPSYFDFVRVRNYFKKEGLDFVQINEYSERSNISRSRAQFYQKRFHFLLFTERFYFFYRYRIRGIKHIIFYQLPLYPVFYSEIINFMDTDQQGKSTSSNCTIIFDKFDSSRLENIAGTQKCRQILSSANDTHMIVTES